MAADPVAPFLDRKPGQAVPKDLPASIEGYEDGGYIGLVQGGRLWYVVVDDAASIFETDHFEEAYRFKSRASLAATFALYSNYHGTASRFISQDDRLPDGIRAMVTKPPRRRLAPLRVEEATIRAALRNAGVPHDRDAVAAGLEAIKEALPKIEEDANWVGSRSSGRELLVYGVEEALKAAGVLPGYSSNSTP